jgi:hypothetical protein
MKLRRLPKIEFVWDKSKVLFGTLCFEDRAPPPPLHKRPKREDPSLHDVTSDRVHGSSIPKIGCHYFWPGLSGPERAPDRVDGEVGGGGLFRVANWLPKCDGILFQPWGEGHNVQHLLVTRGELKRFFPFHSIASSKSCRKINTHLLVIRQLRYLSIYISMCVGIAT